MKTLKKPKQNNTPLLKQTKNQNPHKLSESMEARLKMLTLTDIFQRTTHMCIVCLVRMDYYN